MNCCQPARRPERHVLVMRADRRLHSSLISELSRRVPAADVMLLLDWALLCLTIATGTTHGAPLGFMGNSMQFAGMNQVCVIFEEKFHISSIPARHAGFP